MAASPQAGARLVEAVRRYEAIDDLIGRLGSYAGLVHAGDTIDPARTKFYGDVQERLTTASTHLLFFTLESGSRLEYYSFSAWPAMCMLLGLGISDAEARAEKRTEDTDREWLHQIVGHFARFPATAGLVDRYSPLQRAPSSVPGTDSMASAASGSPPSARTSSCE